MLIRINVRRQAKVSQGFHRKNDSIGSLNLFQTARHQQQWQGLIAMNFPYTPTCSPNTVTCGTGKSNIVLFVTRWIFFVRGTCSYNLCNRATLKISGECHKKILWHASFTKAVCCRPVILIKKRLNHELERVRKSISQNRSERLLLPYQSEYCEILQYSA